MENITDIDEYCRTHFIKNEIWCYYDNCAICSKCISKHYSHRMIHMSELPEEIKKQLNYNSPKREYSIQSSQIQLFNSKLEGNNPHNPGSNNKLNYGPVIGKFGMTASQEKSFEKYNLNQNSRLNERSVSYNVTSNKLSPLLNNEKTSDDLIRSNPNFSISYPAQSSVFSKAAQATFKSNADLKNSNRISDHNQLENKIINPEFTFSQKTQIRKSHDKIYLKFDKECSTLYTFDIKTNCGKKIQLLNFIFPQDSAIINIRDSLFICGGKTIENEIESLCYQLDLNTFVSRNRNDMIHSKRNSSLANIMDLCVYSIGGFNPTENYLKVVEKYIFEEDIWKEISPLPMARQDPSICVFSDTIIYTFGGSIIFNKEWKYLSNIERLDSQNEAKGWEILDICENEGWFPRVFVGCFQLSSNEIMIFGGFDSQHNDEVLILNVDSQKIRNAGIKLRKPCSIIYRNSEYVSDGECVFVIGFPGIDVHRYSFKEKVWKYYQSSKWFTIL